MRANLVTEKVPIIIGNLGETYVLIDPGVGSALRAVSPCTSASASPAEDGCKLTFFHDTQRFGSGKIALCNVSTADGKNLFSIIESSSYPRLYIPNGINSLAKQTGLKYEPCNFVRGREDARDSFGWKG